jgi:(5-formylfuran-3-yl)methyl phosphate synthase
MRLLVSVRSAAEVGPAVAGGADIIDAKDPALGSLGVVRSTELSAIARAVPPGLPLSVALGDLCGADVGAAVLEADRRAGDRNALYLKLGLAGAADVNDAARQVSLAVRTAHPTGRTRVIVVAYADHAAAMAPRPDEAIRVAGLAGADGILLDTCRKDGRVLWDYLEVARVIDWVRQARDAVGLVALAGSLDEAGVRRAGGLGADVVGVRGAACDGGRLGLVNEACVRRIKAALMSHNIIPSNMIRDDVRLQFLPGPG